MIVVSLDRGRLRLPRMDGQSVFMHVHLHAHPPQFGGDASRLALAGESAGGCLAVAELEQRGPLAPLVVSLTRRLTERYLAMETRGLKERCERTTG